MALQLNKEDSKGQSFNYHKVVLIDLESNYVIVASYKDQASRQSNKQAEKQRFSISEIDPQQSILPQVYSKLKESSHFSGAQDC